MPRKYTPIDLMVRLWSKVDQNGQIPVYRLDLGPCWIWTAGRNSDGYGHLKVSGHMVDAHRFTYELLVGSIPPGLELDHLCRVRLCVRPSHLEPVPHEVNVKRGKSGWNWREKTHCPQGHPYDASNTYVHQGARHCRTCRRERNRAAYHHLTPGHGSTCASPT